MHRINGPTATDDNKFTHGDPQAGIPPTRVKDTWLNAVQEEIAGVVEAAGIPLDANNDNQLAEALEVGGVFSDLYAHRFYGGF